MLKGITLPTKIPEKVWVGRKFAGHYEIFPITIDHIIIRPNLITVIVSSHNFSYGMSQCFDTEKDARNHLMKRIEHETLQTINDIEVIEEYGRESTYLKEHSLKKNINAEDEYGFKEDDLDQGDIVAEMKATQWEH